MKLTERQTEVLQILKQKGPQRVEEMVPFIGEGKSYITAHVYLRKMYDEGLLNRERHGSRSYIYWLSYLGQAHLIEDVPSIHLKKLKQLQDKAGYLDSDITSPIRVVKEGTTETDIEKTALVLELLDVMKKKHELLKKIFPDQ